ncbi:ribosome maturation factor RimM [Pyramidobacter piscolens]|uniref:ribosome maturation factor RimM n=1 Tax=Pyramidobacter piscolens TaxID=638849 RepID=UPI0026DF12B0|nr:ribosome maturation factor RimM [Pyramidobacter piscolens]
MSGAARVVIGQVQGTHGLRGEIKIRPLTDFPERFFGMESLSFYRNGKCAGDYRVEGMRDALTRGYFLAALEGVETIEQAELLRGCSVEIAPDERVPLAPGEFWTSDLIGLDACDDRGEKLGVVKDIVDSGPAQLLVIHDFAGKDHLIPAVPEFFRDADLKARRVAIHLIEGLWEL